MGETELISGIVKMIREAGLPTGAIVLGILAAIRVGRWISLGFTYIGERFVAPLVERAMKFIEETAETQREHQKALQSVCASIESIHTTQKEHGQLLLKIHETKCSAFASGQSKHPPA